MTEIGIKSNFGVNIHFVNNFISLSMHAYIIIALRDST